MNKSQLYKVFNLDGYVLDKIEDKNNEILIHCHLLKKSMKYGNESSKNINTSRERKIAHSIFEHKKVFIIIKQRKFYFPKHNKRLWEPLPQVKHKQQSTSAFKKTL